MRDTPFFPPFFFTLCCFLASSFPWISPHYSKYFFLPSSVCIVVCLIFFFICSLQSHLYILKPLPVTLSPSMWLTHSLPSKGSAVQLYSHCHHYCWMLCQIISPSVCFHATQTHTHTLSQSICTNEYTAIDFGLVSWRSHTHKVWHSATSNNWSSAWALFTLKVHWSAAALPFDHLRIVQIDLHKVLLLSVVAIERPVRKCERTHRILCCLVYKPRSFIIKISRIGI